MKSHWKLLSAFLIGAIIGGFAGARCQKMSFQKFWRQGPDTERVFRRLNKKLDLDPAQQTEVRAIIETRRAKVMALHQANAAQFHEVRLAMGQEIKKLLNAEQLEKFKAIEERWARKKQQ